MTTASDGYTPWEGRAGDIRVGHLLQGDTRAGKDIWEVVDTRNPNQYDLGQTPWLRVARVGTGEIAAIPPKTVKTRVTFMLDADDLEFADRAGRPPQKARTMLADAEEVALLVRELGATEIATRDNETGEITCPNYAAGGYTGDDWRVRRSETLTHLKICHGMDTSALEEMDWEEQMLAVIKYHGEAHRDNLPGGFPHRHVPEDVSLL